MKNALIGLMVLMVAGCASVPNTPEDRMAQALRSCHGETANMQGVVTSRLVTVSSRDYAMHECMYRHGFRSYGK